MTSSCEVVKSGEKIEDVHMTTEDVSTKFKFFETYKPEESKKKEFRITPPRDGVVKVRESFYLENGNDLISIISF